MYCEYNEEYVDESMCQNCENTDCETYCPVGEVDLTETELFEKAKEQATKLLGIDNNDVKQLLDNFINRLEKKYQECLIKQVGDCVVKLSEERFQQKTESYIAEQFKATLDKSVLSEDKQKYTSTKVEEIILNRVKKFFADNYDSRDKRNKVIDGTIDNIISKVVEQKVGDAIQSIKEEAIDKFNKEAMKKMMQGMAKAIGADKKLLQILTD